MDARFCLEPPPPFPAYVLYGWLAPYYIEILQQFIKVERTSNFSLHTSTTKQMINLFSAIANNNYAKTCRQYLQSIELLEKDHPKVFEQFVIGNNTG